jgi:hypothetical protein
VINRELCRALIYFCLSFVSDFYRAVKIDSIDDKFVAIARCNDRFIDDKGVLMDYEEIHLEAVRRAKHWHHAELELVEILQLVNKELVWKKKKYTSLFMYAVGALEIPPEHVYRLSGVSKACNDVPELKEALTQGLLSVSEASRLVPVITQENASEWIQKSLDINQKDLEKEVAAANPRLAPREKVKAINATETTLTFSVSHETADRVNRLQDIFAQKFGKPCRLKEVFEFIVAQEFKRRDPVEKAKRNAHKKAASPTPTSTARGKSPSRRRKPLTAQQRHEVNMRDEGQCRFIVDGTRCTAKRWIDQHHVIHSAHGGSNEPPNIITLCKFHHRLLHETEGASPPELLV